MSNLVFVIYYHSAIPLPLLVLRIECRIACNQHQLLLVVGSCVPACQLLAFAVVLHLEDINLVNIIIFGFNIRIIL